MIITRRTLKGFGDADAGLPVPECWVSEVTTDGAFVFADGCDGPAAQAAAIARLPYDVVQQALAQQRATAHPPGVAPSPGGVPETPPQMGPPAPSDHIMVDGRTVKVPAAKPKSRAWLWWTLGTLAVAGAGGFVYYRRRRA